MSQQPPGFEPILRAADRLGGRTAVVDKPAGPSSIRAPVASGTLVDALAGTLAGGDPERLECPPPRSRHRWSRVKSDAASDPFAREIERTYLALVRGRPASRSGRIEAPIGRDRDDPVRVSLDTDSPREAVTHFEIERLLPGHALLRIRLETGRMHQIRVHLAAIDLPVAGDAVYGVADPALGRQFLHAAGLRFTHPFTDERLELESPLPPELQGYLDGLS